MYLSVTLMPSKTQPERIKMNRIALSTTLALSFSITSATHAGGDVITVCPSGCDHTTIVDAIAAATDGDIIQVSAGTYGGPNNLSGKEITIQGTLNADGSKATTVASSNSAFRMSNEEGSGAVIRDLIITTDGGFDPQRGGGIFCGPGTSPIIENVHFEGNIAVRTGGGLHCTNCTATIIDCTFSNNIAKEDGGGIASIDGGNPTVSNSSFCGNTPDDIFGNYTDGGGNAFTDLCDEDTGCVGDIDGDGDVDGADLSLLLGAWTTADQDADLDDNGTVDGADLSLLLAAWGTCP